MPRILFVIGISLLCPIFAPAQQDVSELLNRMKAMEERIKSLEAEVQDLKGQQSALPAAVTAAQPPSTPQQPGVAAPQRPAASVTVQAPTVTLPAAPAGLEAPQTPSGPLPVYGGASAGASKVFNPDISVIGDFLGAAGNGTPRSTPALEMHESEAGFQAIIDPYARADFFITFGEQGVSLEEGYLTFPALPAGLQMKVGKMRSGFGKVNTMHNHVLPWTDRPLVTQNLVGGEDGIDDAGFSFSRILPGPKDLFLEATGQVFRGDSDEIFKSYRRSDLSVVGHLRGYKDLSESTNLDLGVSYARGHSPLGPALLYSLYGVDATIRWKPLRRSIYNSFVSRSEFIWARQDRPTLGVAKPFGFYVSADYQLARRWFFGARFDQSQRNDNTALQDTGGSLILTYWPSEFSQIRGQLRRTSYAEHLTANEFLFQFMFSMGAHGAHPF
ncbi:MAG: hypothetical protein DMG57_43135 [Acidobacteria bacterium]|nr:MAG: hypothetical protein DMG57_43135 [Acidobacteriota bacterium]